MRHRALLAKRRCSVRNRRKMVGAKTPRGRPTSPATLPRLVSTPDRTSTCDRRPEKPLRLNLMGPLRGRWCVLLAYQVSDFGATGSGTRDEGEPYTTPCTRYGAFGSLAPGTYAVGMQLPTDWSQTTPASVPTASGQGDGACRRAGQCARHGFQRHARRGGRAQERVATSGLVVRRPP